MAGKLSGKVALITGGSGGIGLATARLFVEEGAYVFITGRRKSELDAAVDGIGKNITGIQGDVSNLADLDRLYETIKKHRDHIDVLFANAGGGEVGPLGSISEEHFDKLFNVNVKGVVFTVQKALGLMKDGGSIILNASIAGCKGVPTFSVYGATKAAVRSFARSWTLELTDRKIRVNVISPGPIETGFLVASGLTEQQMAEFKARTIGNIPMARVGKSEEVAAAALFLAGEESSYTTGAEIFVDGGMAQV